MNPVAQIAAALQQANPLLNWSEALSEALKVWKAHGGK